MIHVGDTGADRVEGFERTHEGASRKHLDADTIAGHLADRSRQADRAGLQARHRLGPVGRHRTAARIARLLIIQVRTAESGLPLPAKVEAGHYALLGRALHETERGPESTRKAQSLFKKALQLDANSVPALQGFATTKLIQVHNGWIDRSGDPPP